MIKDAIITAVLVDETLSMTFTEICRTHVIPEDVLLELLEQGLLADIPVAHKDLSFSGAHLQRILAACRLHQDLSINPPGVILALELLDELMHLQQQLDMLERYVAVNQ